MATMIRTLVLVLSISSVAAAADKAPAPVASKAPAGMQCATAKRTVIEADGTIRIVTRTVCK